MRRTPWLLISTGFFLLDWLGTVITVSVIAAAIGLVGLIALILFCSRRKHTPGRHTHTLVMTS